MKAIFIEKKENQLIHIVKLMHAAGGLSLFMDPV
jgi:hypothetical protein